MPQWLPVAACLGGEEEHKIWYGLAEPIHA